LGIKSGKKASPMIDEAFKITDASTHDAMHQALIPFRHAFFLYALVPFTRIRVVTLVNADPVIFVANVTANTRFRLLGRSQDEYADHHNTQDQNFSKKFQAGKMKHRKFSF
jgi:hypothetical protein